MSPTFRSERESGRMLLELIVALALGMMVVLAALGTLAFVQASATVHGDALRLQQRADLAIQVIGTQLRQAGAIELVETEGGMVRFSTAFDGHAGSGHAVRGENGRGARPDTLNASHQDDGEARDCLGNRPDAGAQGVRMDSRFSLAEGSLRCLGAHAATGSQVIVDGVEDFQVLYGMRSAPTEDGPFRFVDADGVGERWHEVGAVQVCLQLRSDGRHPEAAGVRNCQGADQAADGRLRRVAHATFSLRNMSL
ncbi:PilW family protein [Pseudorhodoferax sp.]|uniref:PilW family protein n=1 Tax=Pseudorhodoferax sp. TaxID=1993553 RepID=UPI002DD66AD5|nr:PilW family protein [Pseudorhodoferax sp.]